MLRPQGLHASHHYQEVLDVWFIHIWYYLIILDHIWYLYLSLFWARVTRVLSIKNKQGIKEIHCASRFHALHWKEKLTQLGGTLDKILEALEFEDGSTSTITSFFSEYKSGFETPIFMQFLWASYPYISQVFPCKSYPLLVSSTSMWLQINWQT